MFRYVAYIHLPKDERKTPNKTSVLSYGTTRSYRLYDQFTSSIIHSCDVRCLHNKFARGHECEEGKHIESLTAEEPEESEVNSTEPESKDDETEDDSRESDREESTEGSVHRRSTRETRRPDYYGFQVYTTAEQKELQTVE